MSKVKSKPVKLAAKEEVENGKKEMINGKQNGKKSAVKSLRKSIQKNLLENVKKDEYDIDTSDEEDLRNTIGNVPLKWYEDYEHIGYDLDGAKIKKPADWMGNTDQLDEFLNKMENPDYWRTVIDQQTGGKIILSDEDISVVKRLASGSYLHSDYESFDTSTFFTQDEMQTALSGRPEPKSSFIPSKWEKLQVGKYVHAIKMGWIKPQPKEKKIGDEQPVFYDLWGQQSDETNKRHMHHLPAPKTPLPDHFESYNPPPEYMFDEEEKEKWLNAEPEDRKLNFIPQKYKSLRTVPGYSNLIQEKFERCLDLYMCPRQLKMRVQIDPEDLLPQLPKPKDLQPFPTMLAITYRGHKGMVNSISVHPNGQWILSSSNDNMVKCWEISNGKCLGTWKLNAKCMHCSWIPNPTVCLISIACDNQIYIINPKVGDKVLVSHSDEMMIEYRKLQNETNKANKISDESDAPSTAPALWKFYEEKANDEFYKAGHRICISHQKPVKSIAWHPKGDYFCSVLDDPNSSYSVIMNQISRQKSVKPFAKMKGLVQQVAFHPTKPILFVATQRYVKVYDLAKQVLVKKLLTNVKWVSSLDIHPGGDNLIIGSYDNLLAWFDLDLSTKPYKTMKHHKKAIRCVTYHKRLPLFASGSDDGTAIVAHGMVYDDLMQNALIVPLKILRGHEITNDIGVTCCKFHPTQPWLFTCAADNTIRLFTN